MVHAHEIMRTDFILAEVNDSVTSLIGQMVKHDQREAVVYDNTKYLGLASKRWLLSSRLDTAKMKIKNLISHRAKSKTPFYVPKLTPDTELREIVRLMTTADVHALPVVIKEHKKEKVVGLVHALDVIEELKPYYTQVSADEIATSKLITIDENEKLSKAVTLLMRKGIGHIVVVNKANKLIGVLGLTDILTDVHAFPLKRMHLPKAASHQKGKRAGYDTGEKTSQMNLPVSNIITRAPNCCTATPTDTVATIIDEMTDGRVASVILLKKETPIGIVTIKDILEDFSKA